MLPLSWSPQLLAWVHCPRWICGIPFDHGTGHAVGAAAAATLLVLALRYWSRRRVPRALSRAARLVLVAGFDVSAVGQALEMVEAFWLDGVHDLALYPATLGLLLTMLGGLSSLVVAAGRG